MKIVVCVKHVPGQQADRRFDAAGRLVRGEEDVLSELDENAIEAAVGLAETQEQAGREVEVVALTLGPDGAQAAARRALQMGAARGVHVLDERAAGSDALATARILAAAVRREGDVDLVVTGSASADGMTSLLAPALATVLGVPALTHAIGVEVAGATVTVRREAPSADEVLAAPLPAVVSVTDQANSPRYPNMKALLAAKKKHVEAISLDDLGLGGPDAPVGAVGVRVVAAEVAAPRTAGQIVPDSGQGGRHLARWLNEHDLVATRTGAEAHA